MILILMELLEKKPFNKAFKKSKEQWKKLLVLLLIVLPLFAFAGDIIEIRFNNGDIIDYKGKSKWTEYNRHDDYWEYFEYAEFGYTNKNYICISDYVMMNPVSREKKKDDYRHLRDKAEALGHTCHYFDLQNILEDQYGVSFLKSEIEDIEIQPDCTCWL